MLIALTIIFITSIGAINAADIDDTQDTYQTQNTDNIQENTEITKTINKDTSTNSLKATSTSVTNYEELYNNLTSTNADRDTTITLEGDDTYTITNTITLSERIKNLVIRSFLYRHLQNKQL